MDQRYLVVVSVFLVIVSFYSVPVRSYEISDPGYTNDIMGEIDTPQIEPGDDGTMALTLKNPYPDVMENITFTAEIYYYSYLDVEKNISEVDQAPVFEDDETSSVREISNLTENETEEMEYMIETSENTEEGVYSLRFELEFWMDGEEGVMRSRGFFTSDEWYDAREAEEGIDHEALNVSGLLPETTFEVNDPVPRWPQYALGIVSGAAGVLAVMFYMQEKYGAFPELEETFDDWSGKLDEFGSRFKQWFD